MISFVNHVSTIPYKPTQKHRHLREESARLWNCMVQLHTFIRRRSLHNPTRWKWPNEESFKSHFKGKFKLHSQTIQALIEKFFANLETARQLRTTNKKIRYPHKQKYVFNPLFKKSALKIIGTSLRVSLGKRDFLYFKIPPLNGELVQAELGYNQLFLTVQQKITIPDVLEKKVAAIDLGLIHSAVITDGQEQLGVVGRGIRSIKQGHVKTLAKLSRKQSLCQKNSNRWKKLQHRKRTLIRKKERRLRNAFHQASRTLVNWCVNQKISNVVVGDLSGINKNKRGKRRRQVNQEIGMMEIGTFVQYLKYKLSEMGIGLKKESEAYTSKTCPMCLERNTVQGRIYKCKTCHYRGIRDLVGSYNILNKTLNGKFVKETLVPPNALKYLRPISMKVIHRKRSSLPLTSAKVTQGGSISPFACENKSFIGQIPSVKKVL